MYVCAPERFIEAGSATSELSLNDTSSQNICIDTRRRAVVLHGTVSDRGDSVTLNTEDLLVSAALSVPYVYVHSAGREISYFLSNDIGPLLYGRFM